MPTHSDSAGDDLAVIACHFTPQRHERRRLNFAQFREQFGQDLFVAECSFEGGNRPMATGPNGLRFYGGTQHVMWQKERLLNAVIRRLPSHIAYVGWVDADVLFTDHEWRQRTVQQLQEYPVVQMFETVVHLDANGFPNLSYAGLVAAAKGAIGEALVARNGASGFAWAARREVIADVGLMEFLVLGGADSFMAAGFAGTFPPALMALLPLTMQAAVEDWMKQASSVTGGRVGCVPGTIEHLYHGELKTRNYLQRYGILRRAAFDPKADVRIDDTELFTWASPKLQFHEEVRQYFQLRAAAEGGCPRAKPKSKCASKP